MTTPDATPASLTATDVELKDTLQRSRSLAAAVQAELTAAVASCLANATGRGYSEEQLAEEFLGGRELFQALTSGAALTLTQATEIARTCGYRLRIGLEILDDEVEFTPDGAKSAFEVSTDFMAKKLPDKSRGEVEEVVRGVMNLYFGQMREKGLYVTKRGE